MVGALVQARGAWGRGPRSLEGFESSANQLMPP